MLNIGAAHSSCCQPCRLRLALHVYNGVWLLYCHSVYLSPKDDSVFISSLCESLLLSAASQCEVSVSMNKHQQCCNWCTGFNHSGPNVHEGVTKHFKIWALKLSVQAARATSCMHNCLALKVTQL